MLHPDTARSLLGAADALEEEAKLPKNKRYQHAFALSIAHMRAQANAALAPYGEMCRDPALCANKGYCPRDPTCGD